MTKTVYWASWDPPHLYSQTFLSYTDPIPLVSDFKFKINRENKLDNFTKCPAFIQEIKNTYLFKSPSTCNVEFKEDFVINLQQDNIPYDQHAVRIKSPTLYNSYTIKFNANWIFFSEEPLIVESIHPYMHETPVTSHGYYVPGTYDISSWFRPLEYAFQLKENHQKFNVNQDDPLLYIKFKTDESVKLQKFYLTESLFNHSMSCIRLKTYRKERNLKNLYGIFHQSKLRDKILSEIKSNLL